MHLRVTHTLWKPNHGIPNASGYLTHLPCSSSESSVQRKNRTRPETRTNNCLICRALACCMRLGAVPIAAYFVFSHCNAIFEPKKCNGNCSERCTVKPKIQERGAQHKSGCERGKGQEETGNEQLNLSFAVAGCRQRFCLCPRPMCCRRLPACLTKLQPTVCLTECSLAQIPYNIPGRPRSVCIRARCAIAWALPIIGLRSSPFYTPPAVVECVQHVTDTIEMENDLQHDTSSSHGSTIS